jgi:hypothetical protein
MLLSLEQLQLGLLLSEQLLFAFALLLLGQLHPELLFLGRLKLGMLLVEQLYLVLLLLGSFSFACPS